MQTKIILNLIFLLGIINLEPCRAQNDYALFSHKNDWSHHFAYGSPSWDNFERFANNPVYQGYPEAEWPVNGFFFADPQSDNWYLYIGEYRRGYEVSKNKTRKDFNCVIYKSSDKGKTWKKTGDLFPFGFTCYNTIKIEAPDVMVIYEEGKYHMVFDWVSSSADWQHMESSGIGYAVSDSPEGPFNVSKYPLSINTQYTHNLLNNRYWRTYAPMLIKRKHDWVLLHMMDMQPSGAWALAYATSFSPKGPFSDSKILRSVESKKFYPPLQEYFPAFSHNGYSYVPATSVAVNRDYQFLYRVKTEDVTNPDKWESVSENSVWHSIQRENEYCGIWGQTINGFIDNHDSLYVMYPSRTKENFGTINLAKVSSKNLAGGNGFCLSAPNQKSFSYIKKAFDVECINVEYDLQGTLHLIWDFQGLLDLKTGWGKFDLASNNSTNYKEILIGKNEWKVNIVEKENTVNIASGNFTAGESGQKLKLNKEHGKYVLNLNGKKCWEGILKAGKGIVGICVDEQSYFSAKHFVVKGKIYSGEISYGFCEALVTSGYILNENSQLDDWIIVKDSTFLYDQGAVSKSNSAFIKWNFSGRRFKLYSPKGQDFGTINIYIDGNFSNNISLRNSKASKSSVVYESSGLKNGNHALFIETKDGKLPVDCIKVEL
jgi:hypothetical protein